MKSNLKVISNLMIDDVEHLPEYKYIPGDYIGSIYKEKVDVRTMHRELTARQRLELEQYLVCTICRRPCSGTCMP